MGVIIIVFRARDFINVGAVLKVKSTLGVIKGDTRSLDCSSCTVSATVRELG